MKVVGLFCSCGNRLEERPFRIVVSPCRCHLPGHGRSVAALPESFLDDAFVNETQYRERKRLGLPIATEVEKSLYRSLR